MQSSEDMARSVRDAIRIIETLLVYREDIRDAYESERHVGKDMEDDRGYCDYRHYFNVHSEVSVAGGRVLESRKVLDGLRELEANLAR